MSCKFDIYQARFGNTIIENRRQIQRSGHSGIIHELASPDGIHLGYYNVDAVTPGKLTFKNSNPFVQLSYTLSGTKHYETDEGKKSLASFKKQEYNYLFLPQEDISLTWEPGERLETFELGISPELMLMHIPEAHPFFIALQQSIERNEPASFSGSNLFMQKNSSEILFDMLNCPLDGYYKQLYIKSKLGELLAFELEAFEQRKNGDHALYLKYPDLKPADVERMYQVREIILSNLHRPCSLIDLARQVGTNDAYLKRQFKEVFGHTVFGYLQYFKMKEAKALLLDGKPVSDVAYYVGYKHVAHFTRAFKKYFGINPNQVKS